MKEDSKNVISQIKEFVGDSDGLKIIDSALSDYLVIEQKLDKKRITLNCFDLEEVMLRKDEAGKQFLQVNFSSGKKNFNKRA